MAAPKCVNKVSATCPHESTWQNNRSIPVGMARLRSALF